MKTERELVFEHFDIVSNDGIYAYSKNGKKSFITDLVTEYRKVMKTKSKAKAKQKQIKEEFNLIRDSLVEEVESYCNDLFRSHPDIVVFINRTSVNVYDPDTGTTAYTLLSPVSHCVDIRSNNIDKDNVEKLIKSLNYNIARPDSEENSVLINSLKSTKDVAECIFEVITKLKYEV